MSEENIIEIIDTFKFDFYKIIDEIFLLEEAKVDDQKIKILSETIPQVGNIITIKQDDKILQSEITSVKPFDDKKYDIVLDIPLDKNFSVDANAEMGNKNLISDGSSELKKVELNLDGLSKDIVLEVNKVIFVLEDVKEVNTSTFGGRSRLKNGINLRIRGENPKNVLSIKNNKDFALNGFKLKFPKNHPNEKYVVFAKKECSGTIDKKNKLELTIQDDLTTLDEITITVHGHIIKN